jgi:hypothetical protein
MCSSVVWFVLYSRWWKGESDCEGRRWRRDERDKVEVVRSEGTDDEREDGAFSGEKHLVYHEHFVLSSTNVNYRLRESARMNMGAYNIVRVVECPPCRTTAQRTNVPRQQRHVAQKAHERRVRPMPNTPIAQPRAVVICVPI